MRGAAGTLALGAVLLLTAAVFDAEPLYVPGVAFVVLAGGSVAWVVAGARGVRVTRSVGVRRAEEDDPVTIEVRVRAGRAGVPAGVVEDELLPGPAPLSAGRRTTTLRISARFARRGRKVLAPPRVVVRDPFGLATRAITAPVQDELLILPRIVPVRHPDADGTGDGAAGRLGRRQVFAAEVDLDGLRPHREGAPASRIFWPALARGGELMERRMRADGDTTPLVVLDPRAPLEAEHLDDAVRAAASLTVHLARNGGCALLLPGDRRPTPVDATLTGWTALHVRLALIDDRGGPALGGLAARRGPVVYVVARRGARAPRALAHSPGAQRLLVVPGELPGRVGVLHVAGCTAYEVGERRRPPGRTGQRRRAVA